MIIYLIGNVDFMNYMNSCVKCKRVCVCVSVSMVLGIPTVERPKQSYLVSTITSLLFSLTAEEQKDLLIVVCVAEVTHTSEHSLSQ